MAFLDKLGEVAKNVSEKANDSFETNRLTGDIALQKGNIQVYQRELGEYYWAKFAVGEQLDSEAMLICDKIVAAQDKIRELEAQIAQIKVDREAERAERKAAKATEEEAAQTTPEEANRVASVTHCRECGAALAEGQKFCGSCGKSVE